MPDIEPLIGLSTIAGAVNNGRMDVAALPGTLTDITGDITAVQASIGSPVAGGTVAGDVSRAATATAFCTGTFSGINCVFEGSIEASGDANWFSLQVVRTNGNTIETTTGNLSGQPVYAWRVPITGLKRVRVRCTGRASGTQSWRFALSASASEPIPAAQVTGSQSVSLAASGTRIGVVSTSAIWYDDSSAALASNATFTGASRDVTFTPSATIIQSTSSWPQQVRLSAESDVAGTLWLEASRDNTNWRRIKSVATASVDGGGHYAEIIHAPSWRWWRVGYTNGATGQARFTLNSLTTAI